MCSTEDRQAAERPDVTHRPIHYLGSKLRLASDILAVVEDLNPSAGLVCDLFSGSGTVASVLGQSSAVVTVDIQEYARVLASALLQPAELDEETRRELLAPIEEDLLGRQLLQAFAPLIEAESDAIHAAASGEPDALALLLEGPPLVAYQLDGAGAVPPKLLQVLTSVAESLQKLGLDRSPSTVVTRHFGGLYFGIEQAVRLDVLASRARKFTDHAGFDTAMSAVLSAASSAVGTVGKQFAQPLRPRDKAGVPKPGLWKRVSKDRAIDVVAAFEANLSLLTMRPCARAGSLAIRADFRDFLQSFELPLSVVYADPPYTRDHYSRYYHVLETIALGDEPMVSRTNLNGGRSVSRGVYRQERHQSPFSICSKAPGAFEDLMRLTSARQAALVLSYSPQLSGGASRPRVMDIAAVESIARRFFSTVERRDIAGVSHSKLTRSEMHLATHETAELLLVCTP